MQAEQQDRKVKILCNHPLWTRFDETTTCDGCGQVGASTKICCSTCRFHLHLECIKFQDVINYQCHSRHPLKLVQAESIQYTDGTCHFCREELSGPTYTCSICNFSIDWRCWRKPPPLTINEPKSHNHTFTLMATKVSFTCNACGLVGERNPYVCLPCNFMVHRECIDLPRVIEINRHDHRVSRTYELERGDWQCGVCRKKMDWTFGAFSCWRCPNYAVHSKCATRDDVWDGKELENVDDKEIIEPPYKIIIGKGIDHFLHGHYLEIGDNKVTDDAKMGCNCCTDPIDSLPFFKCKDCDEFIIHKVCASLRRLRRNILHNHKLKLKLVSKYVGRSEYTKCDGCFRFFDGFMYKCTGGYDFRLDWPCALISEPFDHELHPHPLYRTTTEPKTCGACGKESEYVLSCIVCDFALGMECATLPKKVKHRCDDHDLSLYHGIGNSKGDLWCDICETKTDPSVWYYGCEDCGVTLHTKCVLGDTNSLIPGKIYDNCKLVPNDGMTRPPCFVCKQRCMFPFFFKGISASYSTFLYVCSLECLNADDEESD